MAGALAQTLAKKHMNRIKQLFDEQFVIDLFRQEVLPHYPAFTSISRVAIRPYKDMVWETTYHVVIAFDTYFLKADGEEIKIPIVCSAHSSEPRKNVYQALKYLWAQGFPTEDIDLPDPIFYSEYFRGTFYRGLKGENLLYYIQKRDYPAVEKIVASAARLFARLHALPATTAANFNPDNSRIRTVTPGSERILMEMSQRYGNKYNDELKRLYSYFIRQEEEYFSATDQLLSLIHGDAHPENIIQTAENRIGLIDFTDFCLGDFARDIGTFLQQLDYKVITKAGNPVYAHELKTIFLDTYWEASGRRPAADVLRRIDLYYNWTSVRTATYWFMKFNHDEVRAAELLSTVKERVKSGDLDII